MHALPKAHPDPGCRFQFSRNQQLIVQLRGHPEVQIHLLHHVTDVVLQPRTKPDTLTTDPLRSGTLHVVQVFSMKNNATGVCIFYVDPNRQFKAGRGITQKGRPPGRIWVVPLRNAGRHSTLPYALSVYVPCTPAESGTAPVHP